MDKDEKFFNEVVSYIKKRAIEEFGYCGVAEGDTNVMLNTGNGNVIITLKREQ